MDHLSRSAWVTLTRACARCLVTVMGSPSKLRRVPAPRSRSASRSLHPAYPSNDSQRPMQSVPPRSDGLRVLVVDDEAPARDEVAFLLRTDARVAQVQCACSASQALKILSHEHVDVLFCDI